MRSQRSALPAGTWKWCNGWSAGAFLDGARKDCEMMAWKFRAKQEAFLEMGRFGGLSRNPLPHFVVCPEVEDFHAADQLLNQGKLAGKYRVFLETGNDTRGFDIALAVRSDLNVVVEMETHKNFEWFDPILKRWMKVFSRDIPVLIIRDGPTRKPVALIFGIHDKSKRDRDGDPESKILAAAQNQAKVVIAEQYRKRFGDNIHSFWMGDLNRNVTTVGKTENAEFDPEILPFLKLGRETLSLAKAENRVTQTFHSLGYRVASQLDIHLISESLVPYFLRSAVVPDFGRLGYRLRLPVNAQDRNRHFMSDHRAIITTVAGYAFTPL